MKVYLIISMASLLITFLATGDKGVLYRPLLLSRARLTSGARAMENKTLLSTNSILLTATACANHCSISGWCDLWCFDDQSPSLCILAWMYVVPEYTETHTEDAISCHTRRNKDFAFGAGIEGPPPPDNSVRRVKENLIDGIYDFGVVFFCYLNKEMNPFFKLDLGDVKSIRRVMLMLQDNHSANVVFNVEVRVGLEDSAGSNFSSYRSLGIYPGPSYASQEIEFIPSYPVKGRFVVIQRWSEEDCGGDNLIYVDYCTMQICHIEIN